MAYGDFKDLTTRTAFDKLLRDNAFSIAKNTRYDGYQRGLAWMVYNFFDKKTGGNAATIERSETLATRNKSTIRNENMSDKELHKQINRKFKKRKVHPHFIDNIWGADLSDIQ